MHRLSGQITLRAPLAAVLLMPAAIEAQVYNTIGDGVAGGLNVATLTTPWNESTVTYNTAPTPAAAADT